MNVIVVNENKNIIEMLNIDIIKKIEGVYSVESLLSNFVNLYFNKMIVDITSIENYTDIEVMKRFASRVEPSRMILLLNSNPVVNSSEYLAELVKCGIYNFTRNLEGIKYLFNNPNSYDSVKHYLNVTSSFESDDVEPLDLKGGYKIIGIQNATVHGGASTLTNLLTKSLNNAGIPTKGIEISRQDLIFYHNPDLISCMTKLDLENTLRKYSEYNFIVDLNEFPESTKYCTTILYLIEPSFIRLTKMLRKNRNALNELKNEKIVLNMSFVNSQDIPKFENETGLKVFDNIPPINDRDLSQPELVNLLNKLGFNINN